MEIAMDTIEARVNKLQAVWTGFLQDNISRDVLKSLLDTLISISDTLTSIPFPVAAAGAVGLVAGLKSLLTVTDEAGNRVNTLATFFEKLRGTYTVTQAAMAEFATRLRSFTEEEARSIVAKSQFTEAQKAQILAMAGYGTAQDAATVAANANTAATVGNTTAQGASSGILTIVKAKWAALAATIGISTTALTAVTAGIAAVVVGGVALYKYFNSQKEIMEETADAAEATISAYKEQSSAASNTVSSISAVKDEYVKLAKGVDNFGNNVKLSNEDFDRYNEISNQIADKMPELVKGWSDQGTAILTCKDNVEMLNDRLDEYTLKAYDTLISGTYDEDGNKIGGAQSILDNYHNQILELDAEKNSLTAIRSAIDELRDLYGNFEYDDLADDAFDGIYKQAPEVAEQIQKLWGEIYKNIDFTDLNLPDLSDARTVEDYIVAMNGLDSDVAARIRNVTDEMDTQADSVKELANAYLQTSGVDLTSDQNLAAQSIIDAFDADALKDEVLAGALKTEMQALAESIANNPTISNAIIGLLNPDESLTVGEAHEVAQVYLSALKEAFANDQELYNLIEKALGDTSEGVYSKVRKSANDLITVDKTGNYQQRYSEAQKLQAYVDTLTTEEAKAFMTWAASVEDSYSLAENAIEQFKATLESSEMETTESFDYSSFSDAISGLDDMYSLYQDFEERVNDGDLGIDLADSIDDVNKLRDSFEGLEGVDWGNFDGFDDILETLTSGTSTVEEMREAYEQLGTSYINAQLAAGEYSETTQKVIAAQLQQKGLTEESANAIVASLTAQAQAQEYLTNSTFDFANASVEEVNAFLNEAEASGVSKVALAEYMAEQIIVNNSNLDTSQQCQALYNVATAAGVAAESLQSLTGLGSASASLTALNKQLDDGKITQKAYESKRKKLESQINSYDASAIFKDVQNQITNLNTTPSITWRSGGGSGGGSSNGGSGGSGSGGSGGSGSSSSDDKDEWLESFEDQYKRLGELRDRDKIDEYEYLQYLRALYEKYLADREKYIDELEEYEYEYLNGMKELYEKVFDKLTDKIDDEIDKLNDLKDAATDALEQQKDAATKALEAEKEAAVAEIEAEIAAIDAQIDAYNDQIKAIDKQIDAYQDEIDAINEANEAREREIALQDALYNLDKMMDQRTNLVYSESQGMHYEADTTGIRDARESVQDAKDDIEIANIEKKIKLLEDQKEAIEELIEALEDQKDALEDQKDEIEDYYDNLIEQSESYYDELIKQYEAYYDAQIKNLENSKSLVEQFMSAYEDAKFEEVLKDMGISVEELMEKIKSGDMSGLDGIFTQYASVVKEIIGDNDSLVESFGKVINMDTGNLPSFLNQTADAFKGIQNVDFNIATEGIGSLRTALEQLENSSAVNSLIGGHLSDSFKKEFENISASFSDFFADDTVNGISKKMLDSLNSAANTETLAEKGAEIGKSYAQGVGVGITSEEVAEANNEAVTTLDTNIIDAQKADLEINDSSSERVAREIGVNVGKGICKGMLDSIENGETSADITAFVEKFMETLKTAFSSSEMTDLFGSTEGTEGGFFGGMLEGLNEFIGQLTTLDVTPIQTLVDQFTQLQQAVTDTATAIGGGGVMMSEGEGEGGATGAGGGGTGKGSSGTTSGGKGSASSGGNLVTALETMGKTANQVLGSAGEEGDSDSEGAGVIGKFGMMKTAVQEVTAAIGTDDEEGSGSGGSGSGGAEGEESSTLIGAFQTMSKVMLNDETGLPYQISKWEELHQAIQHCIDAINNMKLALEELDSFTITVTFGASHGHAAGTVSGHAAGTFTGVGYAFANGTNVGLEQNERAMVGEIGEELLVRNGRASLIGQNGAQMMNLKKGDIIFSHAQTKQLLKNGKINGRGRAIGTHSYADGTPLSNAIRFAGGDISTSKLEELAQRLVGNGESIDTNVRTITEGVSTVARSYTSVPTNTANQTNSVTIGDIHVTGVQDADGLAKAIKSYLPGKMLQELHK